MSKSVEPVPAGYPGVVPYLIVSDPAAAIAFYERAFGATETMRMNSPDGAIVHAEVKIGDAAIMMSGEHAPQHKSPTTLGGTPLSLCIYVPDVDRLAARAEKAGAEVIEPLETKFYGDRSVSFRDPSGHVWAFMTHVENVTPAEMGRRMAEMSHA
jgi:PhnB protein